MHAARPAAATTSPQPQRSDRRRGPTLRGALSRNNKLTVLDRGDGAPAAHGAAVGTDPHAARPRLKKGQLLRRMGRDREANECYNDAIEIDGGGAVAAMAHIGRGETAYDAGRLEEALADYNAAIAIDPGLVAAHIGRAGALAAMGRGAGAPGGHGQASRSGPARAEAPARGGHTPAQPDSGNNGGDAGRDGDSR